MQKMVLFRVSFGEKEKKEEKIQNSYPKNDDDDHHHCDVDGDGDQDGDSER